MRGKNTTDEKKKVGAAEKRITTRLRFLKILGLTQVNQTISTLKRKRKLSNGKGKQIEKD